MALKEPLGTLLVVAIWTVCPCMTPESLAHLLHRLLHSGTRVFLRPTVFGTLRTRLYSLSLRGLEGPRGDTDSRRSEKPCNRNYQSKSDGSRC